MARSNWLPDFFNDTGAGNNTILGGAGSDRISTGLGNDRVYAGTLVAGTDYDPSENLPHIIQKNKGGKTKLSSTVLDIQVPTLEIIPDTLLGKFDAQLHANEFTNRRASPSR